MKLPKFKVNKKRQAVLLIALIVLIVTVWISVLQIAKNTTINKVEITYFNKDVNSELITKHDLLIWITKNFGTITGLSAKDIQISKLEAVIRKNPAVEKAQVYTQLNGTIYLKIKYRTPVIRIKNNSNQEFFVDSLGYKFGLTNIKPQNVLPANGFIPEPAKAGKVVSYVGIHLVKMATFFYKTEPWKSDFEQAIVDNNSSISLIPRVGAHIIEVGNSENLSEKLKNLYYFYKKGLNKIGWDSYKIIDIRYKNQVIGKPSKQIITSEN